MASSISAAAGSGSSAQRWHGGSISIVSENGGSICQLAAASTKMAAAKIWRIESIASEICSGLWLKTASMAAWQRRVSAGNIGAQRNVAK